MEENETNVEKNVVNSIGSIEEITEPHVKQIISAFDGKKFSQEDINKFKQLEKSFRKIATLEDGDSILKNLTSDIRDRIISEAYYESKTGTISIGQVASGIIEMSERAYNEKVEESKPITSKIEQAIEDEKKVVENYDKVIEMKNEALGMKKEELDEYTKKMSDFFVGMGLVSEEEAKLMSDYDRELNKRAMRVDKDGNPLDREAAEAIKAKKAVMVDPTKENIIKMSEAQMAAIKKDLEAAKKEKERLKADIEKAKAKGFSYEGSKTRLNEIYQRTIGLRRQLEVYTRIKESAERGELDEALSMLGASKKDVEEFVALDQAIKQKEDEGDKSSEEYLRLKKEYEAMKTAQKIKRIEESIEATKAGLKNKDTANTKELYILLSKQQKLLSQLTGEIKNYEMTDYKQKPNEILKRIGKDLKDSDGDTLRTSAAVNFAVQLNNMYIGNRGNITVAERQMANLGKKEMLLANRDVTQYAVEVVTEKYEDIYNKILDEFKNSSNEEEKINSYRELVNVRTACYKEMLELNISNEYAYKLVGEFLLIGRGMDPLEYQEYMWKAAISNLKENSSSNEKVKKVEEILKRCQDNKDIFKNIKNEIETDPQKRGDYRELIESLDLITTLKPNERDNLLNATSKQEMLDSILSVYDEKTAKQGNSNPKIKKYIKDLMGKIYDQRGKDGILTLYENRLGARAAYREMINDITKANLKKDYYDSLHEDQHVVMDTLEVGEDIRPDKWPEFIANEKTKMYLDMMFTLRRKLMTENDIATTLIQMDPEAARDAYALYELSINKKALENPSLSDAQKEEIRARNKEIVEMLYLQHHTKVMQETKTLREKINSEKDPAKKEELEKEQQRLLVELGKASNHKDMFDIEKTVFIVPDESVVDRKFKERKKVPKKSSDGKTTARALHNGIQHVNIGEIRFKKRISEETIEEAVSKRALEVGTIEVDEGRGAVGDQAGTLTENKPISIKSIYIVTKDVTYRSVIDSTEQVTSIAKKPNKVIKEEQEEQEGQKEADDDRVDSNDLEL